MNGKRVVNGILGSLAGGLVMGMAMQMMGMIPMIAKLVGSDSTAVGWVVHLVISALLGLVYPVVFGSLQRQWLGGLIYGFIWYILGPLTLMPLLLGMGLQWNAAAVTGSMSSLMGHLIYGLVLALVYQQLEKRAAPSGTGASSRAAR
jgi:uncharacterized membrane protein YagU involved in acid resistance